MTVDEVIAQRLETVTDTCARLEQEADAWRMHHEEENKDSFKRLFDRLDGIEEKLSNRLPLWATLGFSGAGLIIGLLSGSLFILASHFVK